MNDEYLWNRSGEPDEEIVRLEKVLGQLRWREDGEPTQARPTRARFRPRAAWRWAAAAAVVVAGAIALPFAMRGPRTAWQLADGSRVRAGQTIETGASQHAKIEDEDTGEVAIDPGSKLRLVAANGSEQRFDLKRGTIHAYIWAPPGRFTVDTPSSKTVDLGCRYTLQVSQNGAGLLTVEMGWVAFERDKVESFIPAGAACVTRPDKGPGTPYFTDASSALTSALARFDTAGDPAAAEAAVSAAISSARPRDALSLWHLMMRTRGERRAEVFDRFASLVQLPREVTREAILRGDGKAIDAAWDALNLGDTDWWREWKRPW